MSSKRRYEIIADSSGLSNDGTIISREVRQKVRVTSEQFRGLVLALYSSCPYVKFEPVTGIAKYSSIRAKSKVIDLETNSTLDYFKVLAENITAQSDVADETSHIACQADGQLILPYRTIVKAPSPFSTSIRRIQVQFNNPDEFVQGYIIGCNFLQIDYRQLLTCPIRDRSITDKMDFPDLYR
jgi:hypothetical protein